jgi:hypothetical protein
MQMTEFLTSQDLSLANIGIYESYDSAVGECFEDA